MECTNRNEHPDLYKNLVILFSMIAQATIQPMNYNGPCVSDLATLAGVGPHSTPCLYIKWRSTYWFWDVMGISNKSEWNPCWPPDPLGRHPGTALLIIREDRSSWFWDCGARPINATGSRTFKVAQHHKGGYHRLCHRSQQFRVKVMSRDLGE